MFENLSEIRKYANAWVWMYNNERPHSSLGQLTPTEFLLKYGKLSEFPTFQQDSNSNSDWKFLVLNVASYGKITDLYAVKASFLRSQFICIPVFIPVRHNFLPVTLGLTIGQDQACMQI